MAGPAAGHPPCMRAVLDRPRADGATTGSRTAARAVDRNPWLIALGRAGWVAKGVVYLLAGLLAGSIAAGRNRSANANEGEASMSGAVATLAERPFGNGLLVLLLIGLVLYAAWRMIEAVLPGEDDASTWAARAGHAGSALAHLALAWTTVSYLTGPGESSGGASEDARVERATRALMEHGAGRLLLILVGLALLVVATVFVVRGVRRKFDDSLERRGIGPLPYRWLERIGRAGWVGRGVMVGLIGVFVARAAILFEPDEAGGLDASLRRAVDHPVGVILVWIVAAGLVLYGAYCVLAAPRKRLSPDADR